MASNVEIIVKTTGKDGQSQIRRFYSRDMYQQFRQNTSHQVSLLQIGNFKTALK